MKKFFALALALVLTCALAVTCFADSITAIDGTATKNVNVTYQAGGISATVYGVDVVFEDMSFTYTAQSQGTWDPDSHTYVDIDEATWNKTSANVTVTNHSNAAIVATVSYDAGTYEGDVVVTVENGTLNLGSAVDTAYAAAPNGVATVKVSGDAAKGDNAKVVGAITVTIAAPQA